jgi:serine/threonine protein kinase
MRIYETAENLLTPRNTIDEQKLQRLLSEQISNVNPISINNKTSNLTANNIYDIEINGRKYLLKTLLHSQLTDSEKEISNMTKINSNRIVKPYILQCKYLVKTKDTIISIFESVNSMLIKDFITKIYSITDYTKRIKLKRYLIIGLLKAIADLHEVNICHLQLNVNNILVSNNPKYNELDDYSTEQPLIIKFINFNLNFNNKRKKYINTTYLEKIDPYINYNNQIISLDEAKKYDIWCIGLIVLKILLNPDIYYKFIETLITKKILTADIEIETEFDDYYNNLSKYSLTSMDKREPIDFTLNKIILDEKHNL